MGMETSTMDGYGLYGDILNKIKVRNIYDFVTRNNIAPEEYFGFDADEVLEYADDNITSFINDTEDIRMEVLTELFKNSEYSNIFFCAGVDSDGEPYLLVTEQYPWDTYNRNVTKDLIDKALAWLYDSLQIELTEKPDYQRAYFWG